MYVVWGGGGMGGDIRMVIYKTSKKEYIYTQSILLLLLSNLKIKSEKLKNFKSYKMNLTISKNT